jgi:hypothetical protein
MHSRVISSSGKAMRFGYFTTSHSEPLKASGMPFNQTKSGFRRSLRPGVESVIFSTIYFLMEKHQSIE